MIWYFLDKYGFRTKFGDFVAPNLFRTSLAVVVKARLMMNGVRSGGVHRSRQSWGNIMRVGVVTENIYCKQERKVKILHWLGATLNIGHFELPLLLGQMVNALDFRSLDRFPSKIIQGAVSNSSISRILPERTVLIRTYQKWCEKSLKFDLDKNGAKKF